MNKWIRKKSIISHTKENIRNRNVYCRLMDNFNKIYLRRAATII